MLSKGTDKTKGLNETKSEKIKDYLLHCILKEDYKPGDKIVESKIAEELGVSQSPVREAIRDLEVMGFIESEPYKGSYVKDMSAKEVVEAFEIRTALEELAAVQAIENITAEELNKLEAIIDEMKDQVSKKDYVKQTELDREFHKLIIKASRNSLLVRTCRELGVEYWTWRGISYLREHGLFDFEGQASEHYAIYEAIKNKDVEKAKRVINEHFKRTKKLIKEQGL